MVNGTMDAIDVPFNVGEESFKMNCFLADNIYPPISRVVKTISVATTKEEKVFQKWQESVRKDVERGIGVLVRRFMILDKPVEIMNVERIKKLMLTCLILHNIMVSNGIQDDDYFLDYESEETEVGNGAESDTEMTQEQDEIAHRRAILTENNLLEQGIYDIELHRLERKQKYLPLSMQMVEKRYSQLYNRTEHKRLQAALMRELNR
jgi:hypothetical protein